ncbi:MAG: DNA polymerase III subunit delta' [Chloroflexi bacterium]|nr:DNA polymerase III subunit delta' [Chloroflexota bacterium]
MDINTQSWGVIGHDWAVGFLQRAIAEGNLSHAYLITGAPGVGRSTLAYSLASALLCVAETARPCRSCRACHRVTHNSHPDLHTIGSSEAHESLKVEQIRDLQRQISLTPTESSHRVAILQHFDEATVGAQNALLKTLEEPPSYAVLILLAIDADNLLPTIVSRCQHIPLRPLGVNRIRTALMTRWHADADRAELLAHLSAGRLGWAVGALDDESRITRRKDYLDNMESLLRSPISVRFQRAAEMAGEVTRVHEMIEAWIGWWRDVLFVAAAADAPLVNVDRIGLLRDYAVRYGVQRSVEVLHALRRTEDRIGNNANLRLAIEVLMFDLPH